MAEKTLSEIIAWRLSQPMPIPRKLEDDLSLHAPPCPHCYGSGTDQDDTARVCHWCYGSGQQER